MPALQKNMGRLDRIIRAVIGSALICQSKRQSGLFGKLQMVAGGMFLLYSITGSDPLLARFGVSTKPKAENNLFNMLKQTLPGHGDNPQKMEQPFPRKEIQRDCHKNGKTVADHLAIP